MSERREKQKDKNKMLKPNVALEHRGGGGGDHSISEEPGGIDQSLLEKRLEGLRDTQESVQGLSLWCQANKRHSTAIIETWLKILRKSPVEKRLTLFYLSNDVVQHAKRKGDGPVVNQWAFAVQKATPLVRTPSSVSTAIARIFRIWEERAVYSKDTVADLLALLNNVPAKERIGEKKKPETYTASAEKVAGFQPSTLISKIKLAYRLKSHLGVTFRAKPFVHMDMETLKASIKDRSHGMEVIQEIGQLVEQLKASEAKLQSEVEERRKIVETAEIAIVSYENVRGEAKIVNSAYKNFTQRVTATKDKVDEKIRAFDEMEKDVSPVPSPPPEAPSPPPDDDDFGVQPADSFGSSQDWSQNHHKPSVIPTESIRSDIMNALKSAIPPSSTTSSNMSPRTGVQTVQSTSYGGGSSISSSHTNQQTGSSSSSMTRYDPSMGGGNGSMPSLATIQQQFQQSWGGNALNPGAADNYAAMSVMSNMIQQTNNYLQMQQVLQNTNYAATPTGSSGGGYETYQPQSIQHHHHQQPPPLPNMDLGSIPLPPVSDPPLSLLPPPPGAHEMPQPITSHMQHQQHNNSQNTNPYLQSMETSSSAIDNEYVPYHPHDHNMHSTSNSRYEPQYTPSTPTGPPLQSDRYHPYDGRNRRGSDTGSDNRKLPMLASPTGASSNNSGHGGSMFTSNNSSLSQGPEIPTTPGTPVAFDPMQMFHSALNKNRNVGGGGNIQSVLESPLSPVGGGHASIISSRSMSTDSSPSQSYGHSQNSFTSFSGGGTGGNAGMFESFDDPEVQIIGMNGGDDIGDYVEPYTPRQPAMNYTGVGRGRGNGPGPPRGRALFHMNGGPRGINRGGRGGGPNPSPRGFGGGFRGRGSPRGPPRGGRGRPF